jgi:hypothetical protein
MLHFHIAISVAEVGMSVDFSGRIVIEIDPDVKSEL